MRLSEGVEWAAHACAVLAGVPKGMTLSADDLASFHELPAAYMAKHLQALSKAGLVTTTRGARGGYALARAAREISLWDIQVAICGPEPSFQCKDIRRKGPCAAYSAKATLCPIARAFAAAESAYRSGLMATSVADIVKDVAGGMGTRGRAAFARWLDASLAR
jgi:Rrf2 family protein